MSRGMKYRGRKKGHFVSAWEGLEEGDGGAFL